MILKLVRPLLEEKSAKVLSSVIAVRLRRRA